MKYIIIVPDGMADEPLDILGGKTPLEAADTPNLDHLAQHGMTGLLKTIPDKMSPGSDVGNLALLGYDPEKCFFGRAPLEAASQGIMLADNEVAFRCNLVTVVDNKMMDYSAGHISTKEAAVFIGDLNKKIMRPEVKFYVGKSYRHLMVIKTRDPQTMFRLKTTPPHDIQDQDTRKYLPQGEPAQILLELMESSKKLFDNHPVNQVRLDLKENPATIIWLWGQGVRPQLPAFAEKFGVRGGIISAVDLVMGIGKLTGLKVIDVPGATGYFDTNYLGKAQYALDFLKKNDFVYIHIEAPDEAGHNGDVRQKIAAIEHIDKEIIGTILNYFKGKDDVRILVTPDHPTPVGKRAHTREPVPFVMYGKNIPRDGAETYSETAARGKGLKFPSGEDLMRTFMNAS